MKRKVLLIVLMVALFAFIFVLGTSAAAYDASRTSIEYKGQSVPVVKYDVSAETVNDAIKLDTKRSHTCSLTGLTAMADNGAYVILKDTSGNLTAYPSWYIIDANSTEIYEICYAYLNSLSATTGKTYEEGAIVYMEFPQGMTGVRNNGVFGKKNNGAPYETNVTEFHIPKTVTYITGDAFNSMKKIESVYIEAGNTIEKINGGTFSNSSIKYVQFENLTNITVLDGFSSCDITGDIDLSMCTKLETIEGGCFQNSKNIGKITLPNSVKTIGNYAFTNMGSAYLASSYLPTSLESIGLQFFAYNDNLLDTYIFPEGVKGLANEPFQDSKVAGGPTGKQLNLVFLGKVTGVVYLNGNGHQKHAEKVTVYFAQNSLSDYNQNGFYIKPSGSSVTSVPGAIRAVFCKDTGAGTNGSVTGVEYIYITSTSGSVFTSDYVNHADYGFDFDNHTHYGSADIIPATCGENGFKGTNCIVCDKQIGEVLEATGDHKYEDDHDCTTAEICTVCTQTVVEASSSHRTAVTITYENGYLDVGVRTESCENDGCEYCQVTNPKALFEFLGYSKDMASTQICVGYYIAYAEIEEYKSVNNLADLEYGLVAGVSQNIPNAKPLQIVDGEVQAITPTKGSVASIDLSTYDLTLVDFRLTGFEDYQDLEILMCAYVYDGTSLVYLQDTQAQSVSVKTIATIEMK